MCWTGLQTATWLQSPCFLTFWLWTLLDKTICAFPAPSCHYHICHCHHCDTWVRTWLINQTFSGWRDIFKALCEPSMLSLRARVHCSPGKGWMEFMPAGGQLLCHELRRSPSHPTHVAPHMFLVKKTPILRSPFYFSSTFAGWLKNPRDTPHLPFFWGTCHYRLFKRVFKEAETLLSQEDMLTALTWKGWWLEVLASRGGGKTYKKKPHQATRVAVPDI